MRESSQPKPPCPWRGRCARRSACSRASSSPRAASSTPSRLRSMTARGFEELLPSLERRAAAVERSLGGAVTAIFGVPTVHEDDAFRAVSGAVEMRERLAALKPELVAQWGAWLELRIGIGTGEVLAGRDGDAPYATGAPVAEALRLQYAAGAGAILLDERTQRLVSDQISTEPEGEDVRLVAVQPTEADSAASTRPWSAARGSGGASTMRSSRRLETARASSSRSSASPASGSRGSSRSSSRISATRRSSRADAVSRTGRGSRTGPCSRRFATRPSWTTRPPTRRTSDGSPRCSAVTTRPSSVALRLAEVVGLGEQTSSAEETFRAVRTFVEALARRRPLVLVFDDIHWGESTFLDLVDHLADWTHDAPILLVCMARPELYEVRPQWGGGKPNATSVQLEPLSENESAELVDNLAGAGELDDAARRHVVEAASGNPLFVEELLALVLEQGGDAGGASRCRPRSRRSLPRGSTASATTSARFSRRRRSRARSSTRRSVGELASLAEGDVRSALESLVRKELVRPDRPLFSGERAFTFRHLLIRDAAYEAIAEGDPRRAARALRGLAGAPGRGAHARVRRDHRLPPRAGGRYRSELGQIDVDGAELGRRRSRLLGAAGRRAFLRSDAPAGVESHRPRRRAPLAGRSAAGRARA